MDDITKIHKAIGYYLGKTDRALKNSIAKVFINNGYDITLEQWLILMFLWHKDGVTQNDLAKNAHKEKTTITRLIDGLEKRNLIIREKSRRDRRNNLIYLTEYGRQVEKSLLDLAEYTNNAALKGFTEKEIEELLNYLERINRNLKDF